MGWDWNIKLTSEVRPARSWNKSRCAMDIEHCLWDHCQFPPDLAFNCLIPDNAGYPSDYKCGTIFGHLLLTETVLPQRVANGLSVETLRRRGISLDRIGSDIPWSYWIGHPLTVLDRIFLDRIGSNILWPYCRWRFWIIIWLKHPFSKQIACLWCDLLHVYDVISYMSMMWSLTCLWWDLLQ